MGLCKVQFMLYVVYICILVAVVIAAFAEKPGLASLLRCGLLALLQRQSERLGEEPDGDFNYAQCSYANSRFV